jgi:hypothetical protein
MNTQDRTDRPSTADSSSAGDVQNESDMLREALRDILFPRLEGFFQIGTREGAVMPQVIKFAALEATVEQMTNEICTIITDKVGAVQNQLGAEHDRYSDACDEVANLRGMLEWCAQQVWDCGLSDIDGADWQDAMENRGLLKQVPADEAFINEYGYDEMMVLSWSEKAKGITNANA